ncbi:hypothetical protein GE107_13915 [Cohnella sp. CFH 77786]|uniref:hypothetical protein n=1 Tax=Cohnella sp. CFH 77786 TaxID=2662265 RepID=UPI001C60E3CD|nr:hypothetical protein [Cohnella sp. CFH 77786]MBW5447154.1 hypothetical protein [Cohnella sp. CFH 77786]
MKFIKIAAFVSFTALLVAGCSTVIGQSSSCENPPMTLEWEGKQYRLKETNTSAEPVMKFGYITCEEGKFKMGDDDGLSSIVYSHGDPKTKKDIIFGGKWGLALYETNPDSH